MEQNKIYTDEEIKEELKEPFDYGSPEYLKLIEKIKHNREKYRAEQEVKQVMKYKFFKGYGYV